MLFFLLGTGFLIILIGYIWFAYQRALYWKQKGVPHVKSSIFLGNLWEVADPKKPWSIGLPDYTKKYGKLWGFQEGIRNVLVVADPKLAHEILVTRFEEFQKTKRTAFLETDPDDPSAHLSMTWGARWKRLRSLVAPQFSNQSLKKILPTVRDSADHLVNHLSKKEGSPIDIQNYFQEYTMDIIARIAMGQKGSRQWESKIISKVDFLFRADPRNLLFLLASAMPWFKRPLRAVYFLSLVVFGRAVIELMWGIEKAVKERKIERANGQLVYSEKDHIDFIDLFLDAEAEVDLSIEKTKSVKDVHVSKQMLEREVIMQLFLFLVVGYDTTSTSLSFAAWYLAKHPKVLKRVQEEIDQVCQEQDITYDQVNELKYMDRVMKESLRLNPLGVFATGRVVLQRTVLSGVQLEGGDSVQIDVYSIHYSKEIWGDDAEEFNPDRFLDLTPEQKEAYLAFGGGPRQCVGLRLAYLEEKMALASILRKYDILECSKTEKKLDLYGWTTISPKTVTVQIKKRTH